jgi:phthalate 4,5-dioxygenase reductase subunit
MSDTFHPLRVARKTPLTPDITLFALQHPDGHALPTFTPGAHIVVETPAGSRRSYSLCGDPQDTQSWHIAIKREAQGRGGSLSMADDVQEGDLLLASPWANLFELQRQASSFVFVAGGIGITPILSMIHALRSQGHPDFKLYYCTRDKASTAFLDALQMPDLQAHVTVHHDHGDLNQALDLWPIFERPSQAHVYCCGPQGLMDSVRDMTGHWPSAQIHFESFGASDISSANDQPFEVVLQHTGERITIPAQQSILETLRACGHHVPSSCESGVCGCCRTGLITGEADHRDLVLRPDEQATHIMVCVSRAKSQALVLDL